VGVKIVPSFFLAGREMLRGGHLVRGLERGGGGEGGQVGVPERMRY